MDQLYEWGGDDLLRQADKMKSKQHLSVRVSDCWITHGSPAHDGHQCHGIACAKGGIAYDKFFRALLPNQLR